MLAETFRLARTPSVDNDSGPDSPASSASSTPAALPRSARPPPLGGDAPVVSLFKCTFGDIGLAASIFGLLGTPTDASWPVSAVPTPPSSRGLGQC